MDIKTDILIAGGSLGGCAAALACASMGQKCVLTEETEWIGGQATAQGVPPDEHPFIEQYGKTRSYGQFREKIRDYYRRNYRLTPASIADPFFNPGAGWVSGLGFEPKVGLAALYEMMAPYITKGLIQIYTGYRPVSADVSSNRVHSVCFEGKGESLNVFANYTLDATELGELLPLTKTEHAYGAESASQTGEPLALSEPDPFMQQGFTHLAALSYHPGENHVMDKPNNYDHWRKHFNRFRGQFEGEYDGERKMHVLFANDDEKAYLPCIWNFRRCYCGKNFEDGGSDITMLMNGNEYTDGVLIGVSEEERARHLQAARERTLAMVHFLQTEVENGYNGKNGFPGLRLRPDVFGTADGLAQYPYIRESRRIKAEFTVLEQHFHIDYNPNGPMEYPDSVGVGGYRIDIHLSAKGSNKSITRAMHGKHYMQQIPLGALIPVQMENLLPACKNAGVTHITNGAFRLHPVEWNLGEAAGYLAAYCVQKGLTPREVRNIPDRLSDFQSMIKAFGIETGWQDVSFGRSYYSHFENVPNWYFGESARR